MTDPSHGGLRLPSVTTGVGVTTEEEIHQRWQKYDTVLEYISTVLGIQPPQEPDYALPELRVEDLTTPDSTTYTETYTKINAWFGYLSEVKARHDAKVLEIEVEMEDLEATTRERMRQLNTRKTAKGEPKPPSAQEMSDTIAMDSRYRELKQQKLFQQQVLKLLNARVEKVDRELRLISRQVEIRKQDFEQNNRQGSMGSSGRSGYRRPYG